MKRREFTKLVLSTVLAPSLLKADEVSQHPCVENIVEVTACGVEDFSVYKDYQLRTFEQEARSIAHRNSLLKFETIKFSIDLNKTDVFIGDLIIVESNDRKRIYRVLSIDFPQKVLHG